MKTMVITGTTSGLGYEAVRYFANRDWKICEMNRPDFDIMKPNMSIISEFDVFINNAYGDGFAQTKLLYKVFEEHKNRECMIVNIGSVSGDGDRQRVYPYAIHKAALEKASIQLALLETNCKVCLIKPGRMYTPMTEHRTEYYRMPPTDVVKAIDFMVNQPKQIIVKSLTIDVHKANRKIYE